MQGLSFVFIFVISGWGNLPAHSVNMTLGRGMAVYGFTPSMF